LCFVSDADPLNIANYYFTILVTCAPTRYGGEFLNIADQLGIELVPARKKKTRSKHIQLFFLTGDCMKICAPTSECKLSNSRGVLFCSACFANLEFASMTTENASHGVCTNFVLFFQS
jgi:hypothetical protein